MSTSSQPPRKETPLTGEKSSTESESVLDPDLQRLRMFYGRALEKGGLTRVERLELMQELEYRLEQGQFTSDQAARALPGFVVPPPAHQQIREWYERRRRMEGYEEHPLMREEREALTQRGMLEVDPRGDSPFKDLRWVDKVQALKKADPIPRILSYEKMRSPLLWRYARGLVYQPCSSMGPKHMVHTKETWENFETLARMGYLVEETAVLSPWADHVEADPFPKEVRARFQELLKRVTSPAKTDTDLMAEFMTEATAYPRTQEMESRLTAYRELLQKKYREARDIPETQEMDWSGMEFNYYRPWTFEVVTRPKYGGRTYFHIYPTREEMLPIISLGSSPSTPGTTSGSTLTWRERSSYLTNRDWSVRATGPSNSSESPNETTGSC